LANYISTNTNLVLNSSIKHSAKSYNTKGRKVHSCYNF